MANDPSRVFIKPEDFREDDEETIDNMYSRFSKYVGSERVPNNKAVKENGVWKWQK